VTGPIRPLLAVAAVGVLLTACSSSTTSTTTTRPKATTTTSTTVAPTTAAPTSTTQAAGSTTTTVPAMIVVDAPRPGVAVTSPFTLSGSANVYEAALNAELVAADGFVLDSTAFQATAGTGTWGTYSTPITFPGGHPGTATLTVYSISAKDGSRINQVSIPVVIR